jgi:hypothetical protein
VTHTMSWASTVCLERLTKKRVLYALISCTVAYFACYGIVDENNLLQSGLIIGREAEEKLSVADLESVTVFSCCNKASKLPIFLVHGTLRLLSLSGSCSTIPLSSSRFNHLASCFIICLVRSSVVMRLG